MVLHRFGCNYCIVVVVVVLLQSSIEACRQDSLMRLLFFTVWAPHGLYSWQWYGLYSWLSWSYIGDDPPGLVYKCTECIYVSTFVSVRVCVLYSSDLEICSIRLGYVLYSFSLCCVFLSLSPPFMPSILFHFILFPDNAITTCKTDAITKYFNLWRLQDFLQLHAISAIRAVGLSNKQVNCLVSCGQTVVLRVDMHKTTTFQFEGEDSTIARMWMHGQCSVTLLFQ